MRGGRKEEETIRMGVPIQKVANTRERQDPTSRDRGERDILDRGPL